jgi:hypothetical protein
MAITNRRLQTRKKLPPAERYDKIGMAFWLRFPQPRIAKKRRCSCSVIIVLRSPYRQVSPHCAGGRAHRAPRKLRPTRSDEDLVALRRMSSNLACSVVPTMEICPDCKSEMTITQVTPILLVDGFEGVTYRCTACRSEMKRTFRRRSGTWELAATRAPHGYYDTALIRSELE